MRLVTYSSDRGPRVGVLLAGMVVSLDAIADTLVGHDSRDWQFGDIGELLRAEALPSVAALDQTVKEWLAEGELENRLPESHPKIEDISLLPPVIRPAKVIGVGMNYRSFVGQIGEEVPRYPTLFHKTSAALTGHNFPILIPPNTREAVPEGELAIVVGRGGSFINLEEAASHIAGYACANDVSARNLEFRTSQWTSGKMLPTFCPLGPALVTPDEVPDPENLHIVTTLNGQLIQRGSTSEMIFSAHQLVSEISELVTLEPGDVILSGTPSDLGELTPPVFLSAGDRVAVRIDGVGVLENPVGSRCGDCPHA